MNSKIPSAATAAARVQTARMKCCRSACPTLSQTLFAGAVSAVLKVSDLLCVVLFSFCSDPTLLEFRICSMSW